MVFDPASNQVQNVRLQIRNSMKFHYLYIDGTKKANPCVGGARRDLDRGPDARCEPRGVSFGTFIFYI